MKEINLTVAAVVIVGLIGLPLVLWNAYVMTLIWHWYAPEAWGALPLKSALCVVLIYGLLRNKGPSKDSPGFGTIISTAIVGPLFLLGFGWLLLWFVQ